MDFIIHFINKDKDKDVARLDSTDELSTLGAGVGEELFLDSLQKLFKSQGMLYGDFSPTSPFEAEYKAHSNDGKDPVDLVAFSLQSAERLRLIMEDTQFSTGGFICYLSYESDGDTYLMVLILNLTDAFTLQKNGSQYSVVSIEHLDLKHLRMGLQFNVSAYQRGEEVYIYFQSGGSKDTSDYFYKDYAGTKNIIPPAKSTRTLMKWLNTQYDLAAEHNNCEKFEFKARVDTLLFERDEISLNELKEIFFPGDKEKQDSFIESANEAKVPQTVVIKKSVLNQYRVLKVKPEDSTVDLKFTTSDVEEGNIIVDHEDKQLIIPRIDKKLLEKLK